MTTLTDEQIADLRQRVTPGPWASEAGNGPSSEWYKANVGVWSHDRLAKSDAEDGDDPMDDAWVCGIWGRLSDEDLANAAAIALVPDLLAEVARLRVLLRRWQQGGCPDCHGDCASANPPVMCCIVRETAEALRDD